METFKHLQRVLPRCLASDVIRYALPPNFSDFSVCKTDFVEIYKQYIRTPSSCSNIMCYKAQFNGDAKFLDEYIINCKKHEFEYRILGSISNSYNDRIKLLDIHKYNTDGKIMNSSKNFINNLLNESPNLMLYMVKNFEFTSVLWVDMLRILIKNNQTTEMRIFCDRNLIIDRRYFGNPKKVYDIIMTAICYISKTNDIFGQFYIEEQYKTNQSYWIFLDAMFDSDTTICDEFDIIEFLPLYFVTKNIISPDFDDTKILTFVITKYTHMDNIEDVQKILHAYIKYIHWDVIIELYENATFTNKWPFKEYCSFAIDNKTDITQLKNDIAKYGIFGDEKYRFPEYALITMNLKQLYYSKTSSSRFRKLTKIYKEFIQF